MHVSEGYPWGKRTSIQINLRGRSTSSTAVLDSFQSSHEDNYIEH